MRVLRVLLWLSLLSALVACDGSPSDKPHGDLVEYEQSLIEQTDTQLGPLLATTTESPAKTQQQSDVKLVAPTAQLESLPETCKKYLETVQRCVDSTKNPALVDTLNQQKQQLLQSSLARDANTAPFAAACEQALEAFLRIAPAMGC